MGASSQPCTVCVPEPPGVPVAGGAAEAGEAGAGGGAAGEMGEVGGAGDTSDMGAGDASLGQCRLRASPQDGRRPELRWVIWRQPSSARRPVAVASLAAAPDPGPVTGPTQISGGCSNELTMAAAVLPSRATDRPGSSPVPPKAAAWRHSSVAWRLRPAGSIFARPEAPSTISNASSSPLAVQLKLAADAAIPGVRSRAAPPAAGMA